MKLSVAFYSLLCGAICFAADPKPASAAKPAAVFVCQDGVLYKAPTVFDNLIAKKTNSRHHWHLHPARRFSSGFRRKFAA
jgi:hypothetical protein